MSSFSCNIAIVGIGVRLPGGVHSCGDFWDLLINGRDGVTEIPPHRWSRHRFLHGLRSAPGRSVTFSAGVIDDLDHFDCSFFGISEREARSMDPQQRLALELAWEMFENANARPSDMAGANAGVYIGASSMDAALASSDDPWNAGPFTMTGNSLSIISNRLSFVYDLRGPSMTLDTACSSSLVAVCEACRFLGDGQGDFALAGGVNSLYSPFPFIGFSKAQMLAEHGRCKVFDQDGNGYVRAEGGVLFLLKRLEDAVRDGDPVHAVIRGAGANSDGMTHPGMSFPNIEGQKQLLSELYGEQGFDPETLSYMEAHGTGTAAGDPVEIGSLGEVIGRKRSAPLLVGSAKSSVGHLEPASGVTGMLRSILIMKNKVVPPNIHLKSPLDTIDFSGFNIVPVKDAVPLPDTGAPARVGVNSFGFGGTNAHVLLEEFAAPAPAEEEGGHGTPLFLSARSQESLRALAGKYAARIGDAPDSLPLLAATAVRARDLMNHRLVAEGVDPATLTADLAAFAQSEPAGPGMVFGEAACSCAKCAFVFSGNGAQWDGMGASLYPDEPLFREAVDEVDAILEPKLGWSLVERMRREKGQELDRTEISQPMLFAYQVGLVCALAGKGITPDMVYGHSVGEVTAAWASGALDLEQACEVILHRSLVQAGSRGTGRMAVAKYSLEQALALPEVADGLVEVAAVNSPDFVTLSGDEAGLLSVQERVKVEGGVFRMLKLDYPFHSRRMDSFRDDLLERLKDLKPGPVRVPFLSANNGESVEGRVLGADYWWANIRDKVDFHAATATALDMGAGLFLEIGPNDVLKRFLSGTVKGAGKQARILPTMKLNRDSGADFTQAWKHAFVNGAAVDFSKHVGAPDRRLPLPTYAWNKVDVSLPATSKSTGLIRREPVHPLLGFRKDGGLWVWENTLDSVLHPFLGEHLIYGDCIIPGAAILDLALAAAHDALDQSAQELIDFALVRPLPVPVSPAMDIRCTVSPEDGSFRLESRPLLSEEQWTLHAMGRVALRADAIGGAPSVDLSHPERFGEEVDVEDLYKEAYNTGLQFGPGFRPLKRVWVKDNRALAELDGVPRMEGEGGVFDPCLLDGCFHSLLKLIPHVGGDSLRDVFLPAWFGRVSMVRPGVIGHAVVTLDRLTDHSAIASFEIVSVEGDVIGRLQECRFIRMRGREAGARGQRAFALDLVPIHHPARISNPEFSGTAELYASVEERFAELGRQYKRSMYYEELRPLCQAAILSHLYSLLIKTLPPGLKFTIDHIRRFGGLNDGLLHFVVYLLRFLESMGAAECIDGAWTLKPNFDLPDAELVWRSIVEDYPAYLPETVVLGRIGMHLVNILRGKRSIDDILSYEPGGLLESFYTQSPSARFQNTQIATLVELLRSQLPEGRPLRILEVGTGFGGMFQTIVNSIPSEHLKYTCVDKNEDVLQQLKAANPDFDRVTYMQLDIEEPLPESFALESHDIVLASHVLHELDNLDMALGNCRKLLAPNGMMIAVERNPDPLIDIFLGVDPNWWKLSPSVEDPVSRLLPMEAWTELFQEAGFKDFLAIGEEQTDYPESYILLSRKDCPEEGDGRAEEDVSSGLWLVVADVAASPEATLVCEGVMDRLARAGQEVVCITGTLDEAERKANPEAIDFSDGEAWKQALMRMGRSKRNLSVVNLAGFGVDDAADGAGFQQRLITRAMSVTMFGKACQALGLTADFWVVCGGALGGGSRGLNAVPSQAAAWGAARVLSNEADSVTVKMVDLHCAEPDASMVDDLVYELLHPAVSMEIVLCGKDRLIPRLVPLDRLLFEKDPHTKNVSRISLQFDNPGKLDNLYWKQEMDLVPEADQVLLKVRATGLNFRDVMFSMGMLPPEALEDGLSGPVLGLECSGEIMSVGRDVKDFQVGDEVMCMSGPCFASHICVDTDYVFAKPTMLSFEEAATIPVAFSTAYYALKELANVKEGDRVLIHSAAGGVGLASIQVANHLGAEVYATAGSEEKREFLKLLGVSHVMDSRSLTFYDDCLRLTGGEGVDVVLNSLAGEALFKSLKLLKPFGRFLELGKRDFYGNSPLRMRMLRKNITFFGIDLDEYMACKPKEARRIFNALIELFQAGEFKPIMYSVFNRAVAVNAFKAMQRGKHIGKMIVAFDELNRGVQTLPKHRYKDNLDGTGTYLVTGGTAGFGLATARRLACNGAANLLLLSRSGGDRPEAAEFIEAMAAKGIRVKAVKGDVADRASLYPALDAALADMPPLRGVVHSAAVLRDSMIANITREQVETSLMAKAVGAWNLHEYTRDMALDSFTMYSSATTVLGNPGQVNYVAANMALEALAQHRRASGLPATTYGWGAISDTGMLTGSPEVLESLRRVMGVAELTSTQALDYMDMSPDEKYVNLFYFNLDWNKARNLKYIRSTMFNWIDELRGGGPARTTGANTAKALLAMERDEAIAALVESIGAEVAAMLKVPFDSMDTSLSIAELGLDSLMAVELGLLIEERYGVKVSSFSMNVNSDLAMLSERIYEALLSGGSGGGSETEEVVKAMREKHGITANTEVVSRIMSAVNEEMQSE